MESVFAQIVTNFQWVGLAVAVFFFFFPFKKQHQKAAMKTMEHINNVYEGIFTKLVFMAFECHD